MNANFYLSCFCKGIAQKQFVKPIIIIGHSLGKKEGRGIPDCEEPIGWIALFMTLKSVMILQFPDLFLITNRGELQGLVNSSIFWAFICSCTSCSDSCNFPDVRVHYSTLICQLTMLKVGLLVPLPTAVVPGLGITWIIGDCSWEYLLIFFFLRSILYFIGLFLRLEEC